MLYIRHVSRPIARCIVKLALHQGDPHIHGDKLVVQKWNVLLPKIYTCNIKFYLTVGNPDLTNMVIVGLR